MCVCVRKANCHNKIKIYTVLWTKVMMSFLHKGNEQVSTSSMYFSSRAKAKEIFSKFYLWLPMSSWIPRCSWLKGREKRSVHVFKSDPQIIWYIYQNVRFIPHPVNSGFKQRGGIQSIQSSSASYALWLLRPVQKRGLYRHLAFLRHLLPEEATTIWKRWLHCVHCTGEA